MHFLIILFSLVAIVSARPGQSRSFGLTNARSISTSIKDSGLLSDAITIENANLASLTGNYQPINIHGNRYTDRQQLTESNNYNAEPNIKKHFYYHSAPNIQSKVTRKHFKIGRPQQSYRVIFIKTPSHESKAELSVDYAPVQEKTAIYLLTQNPGELKVGDIPTPPPAEVSKPEVFILKYKTDDEAEQARKQIQASYDSLGGSSQVTQEKVKIYGISGKSHNIHEE